ncbi:MAG: heat-inducible transcriptional repressor HrcA [Pseudomonadota bacterium]
MIASSAGVSQDLDERARDIFRRLVETYLDTGEPVGSRTLSREGVPLSAASIRNVMADLTDMGLLYAPHTSAGRLPTDSGLRLFVDAMMETGDPTSSERHAIEHQLAGTERSFDDALAEISQTLSGLTNTAALVTTVKTDTPLKHLEFVATSPGQALVVMVAEDGQVENRIVETPAGLPPASLIEAGNFLNARLRGRTLSEARAEILREIEQERNEIDELTARLVAAGIAERSEDANRTSTLMIRGRANLLEPDAPKEDLARVRMLFDDLERKQDVIHLLQAAADGEGVRVFIGSENPLFSLSGSSVVFAPFRNEKQRVVGVLGVIGPTRLNYGRVVPVVDYTAEAVSRLLK